MGSTTDKIKGRVKEAVGVLTANDRLKSGGQTDQVVGEVKEAAERAAEKVRTKWNGLWRRSRTPERRQTQRCCRPWAFASVWTSVSGQARESRASCADRRVGIINRATDHASETAKSHGRTLGKAIGLLG